MNETPALRHTPARGIKGYFAEGSQFQELATPADLSEASLAEAVETLAKRYEAAHPGQLMVLANARLVVSYEVETDHASVLEREVGHMFGRVETHRCENWRLWALGLDDIVVLGLGEP